MSTILAVNQDRFKTIHGVIYLSGTIVFIGFFVLEKLFGIFSKLVSIVCCCLNRDAALTTFSTDLLSEIDSDRLEQEYSETVTLIRDLSSMLGTPAENEANAQLLEFFCQRLEFKLKQIKTLMQVQLLDLEQEKGDSPSKNNRGNMGSTKQDFN